MTAPLLKTLSDQLASSQSPVFVLGNPGTGMVASIEEAVKIQAAGQEVSYISLSALDLLDAVPTPLLHSNSDGVVDALKKLTQESPAVLHVNIPTQLSKNEQQALLDVMSSREVVSGKNSIDLSNTTLVVSGYQKLVDPEFLAHLAKVSTILTTPDIEPVSAQSIQQRRQEQSTPQSPKRSLK